MGEEGSHVEKKKAAGRTSLAAANWVLFSFSVSAVGGFILIYWSRCYHEANEELWMVPVGILLFGVPIFVWFSVVASEACRWPEDSSTVSPEPDEKPDCSHVVVVFK